MSDSRCPDRRQLSDYLLDRLPADALAQIDEHLSQCSQCQKALDTWGDGDADFLSEWKQLVDPQEDEVLREYGWDQTQQRLTGQGSSRCQNDSSLIVETIESARIESGKILGGYRLLGLLGAGGMGEVYLAENVATGSSAALKVVPASRRKDRALFARFQREIKALKRLQHPNIACYHESGDCDDLVYLVMEYVHGVDLEQIVKSVGRVRPSDACEIVHQLAEALEHVNSRGLVHRDLKPSNVMVTSTGITKILDLGLAKWQESPAELSRDASSGGALVGTLDYMAPEQAIASHEVSIQADIYSLGCTLFKLLIGTAPLDHRQFNGNLMAQLNAIHQALMAGELPNLVEKCTELPPGLTEVLQRMIAVKPGQRYQTPAEVAQAIAPFAEGHDLPALVGRVPASPLKIAAKSSCSVRRRASLRWGLGSLVATSLLGVVVFFATHYGELSINVVDGDGPKVVVSRSGKVIEILDTREKQRLRLRPDMYELALENSDNDKFELSSNQVMIRRGTMEIAQVRLRPAPNTPDLPTGLSIAAKATIVADWKFAQDAKQKRVRDGQMLLSFEGDGRLWDDSGENHSANTIGHPRYKKYDPVADPTRDGMDGWALQTGNGIGSLWCPTDQRALARGDYFSVWCRVRLDRNDLSEDQALLARPGDWELSIRKDGRLIVRCGSSTHEIEQAELGGHEAVPLTDWVTQWIDIGLTFDRDANDKNGASVVTVYLDGVPWFTRRGVTRNLNSAALYVGCRGANVQVFDGLFDRILIYDGVLDAPGFRALSTPRLAERVSSASVLAAAVSLDGSLLATGGGREDIELRAFPTVERRHALHGHTNLVHSLEFSRNGKWLASASEDMTARIWDVASGKEKHILEGHYKPVFCVAFSTDDKWLVTTGADAAVRVWNVETGEQSCLLTAHRGWVWAVAFSPDGKWMATGEGNPFIKIWEVPTFREVATLVGHQAWVRTLVFSPDSKLLYSGSGDHTIRVWDFEQRELKATVAAHSQVVQSLDVSPDGRVLVSGGFDHAVKFWNTGTLEELPIGGRHARRLQLVRFLPQASFAVGCSEDGAIRFWPVRLSQEEPIREKLK